jgi:enterochelin esterase-like enzyme
MRIPARRLMALTAGLLLAGLARSACAQPAAAFPDCVPAGAYVSPVCRISGERPTATSIAAILGGRPFAVDAEGDVLRLYGHGDYPAYPVRGGLAVDLQRVEDSDYWSGAWRLVKLDEAMLFFAHPSAVGGPPGFVTWRGPAAPQGPQWADPLEGSIENRVITSEALGENRRVAVYQPNTPADAVLDVLVITDGEAIESVARLIEPLMSEGRLAPTLVVGVFSGPGAVDGPSARPVEDVRPADYLIDFPEAGDRHGRYLRFFTREVPVWIRAHYPVTFDTYGWAAFGQSDGAAFVLRAALGEGYGRYIAASPAWRPIRPEECSKRDDGGEVIIAAGLYEPPFLATARQTLEALQACGYTVSVQEYAAGHTPDVPNNLLWRVLSAPDLNRSRQP